MIRFSKFLSKPEATARERPSAAGSSPSECVETMAELEHIPTELEYIPTEEVEVRPEARIVFHSDPQSPGADRFRFLRMRLREARGLGKLQRILITSPLPEDGKSTISLNLATALAEGGKRKVLLIEADFHHTTLVRRLGIQTGAGFAECLENDLDPVLALRRLTPLSWYLLQAGTASSNPTELLQSDAVPKVIQRLSGYFDWVLIDTPPVVPLTDALTLSRHVDTSLLVVRAGRTPREAVAEALALLGSKHTLGIILNGAEGLNRLYSKYHQYYRKT